MSDHHRNGITSLDLLLVAFIVLKLTHYIDWSWWFVLMPGWIPLLLVLSAAVARWVSRKLDPSTALRDALDDYARALRRHRTGKEE